MKDGGKGQLLGEKLSQLVMMNSFCGQEIDIFILHGYDTMQCALLATQRVLADTDKLF